VNGLITPNLLKFGNNFYNCALIESVPLENERFYGSIGAHFERASFSMKLSQLQIKKCGILRFYF
jgi:hypothetical protein